MRTSRRELLRFAALAASSSLAPRSSSGEQPGGTLEPCSPPDGSSLPSSHRHFLVSLVQLLADKDFRPSRLAPLRPGIVNQWAELCSSEDDVRTWCAELERWVRWYRLYAYWLTDLFQQVAMTRQSVYFFWACQLYSDAQTLFADDLALSSLETAYSQYLENQVALGKPFEPIGDELRSKLHHSYDFYHRWTRPFEYSDSNPCAVHLYLRLSQRWLIEAARKHYPAFDIRNADALRIIISQCESDDVAFYAILARRFLGLLLAEQNQFGLSIAEYEAALAEARRLKLDTEIGHLERLLGHAQRQIGNLEASRFHFEKALEYEKQGPAFAYTSYWQALSARELGDTLFLLAGQTANVDAGRPGTKAVRVDDPEKLRPALLAYRAGRVHLDAHLTIQSPLPLARAAKQQLFRSFSTNSVKAACLLQSTIDMLAEVEWNGPRQITELVSEIAATRNEPRTAVAEFRRRRAIYYSSLNTMPPNFEDYLASATQHYAERRQYLKSSIALQPMLFDLLSSDKNARRALALRLPKTIFLLFHVGTHESIMVLADVESGAVAPFNAPFGEHDLRPIHEEYQRATSDDGSEGVHRSALDKLLLSYANLLDPLLEPILKFLPDRHLKIFPRLQMNAVPLHAVRIKGKMLIDHCASLSYGQTLGLFLENHRKILSPEQGVTLRYVSGEGVPFYDLIETKLQEIYGGMCISERPEGWPQLMGSISARPASDTLFACHGFYDADNLDGSYLRLAGDRKVGFSEIFAQLDLRGCRSVIMGACGSGLARAEIGAEYIGLPSAMLASGAQHVLGALWTIPQLATAVLMLRYLELAKSSDVCSALCRAQCEVRMMTRDDLSAWLQNMAPANPELPAVLGEIARMDQYPFEHPYHWAGLHAVGDI